MTECTCGTWDRLHEPCCELNNPVEDPADRWDREYDATAYKNGEDR